MDPSHIQQLVERFFTLLQDEQHSNVRAEAELHQLLDELAVAQHVLEEPGIIQEVELPDSDVEALRAQVVRRFPELGLYNVVLNPAYRIGHPSVGVGDAIEDLVDIAFELSEVRWRFRHTDPADAVRALRFGFRAHWGEHLRDLQRYLHDLGVDAAESGDPE